MSRVLGISAFYHDSAAAILDDGEVVAAAQEERFTRKRHDAAFPRHALTYCLEEAGLSLDELDAVVFYDKPFLKFERLLETYYAFAPRGLRSFLSAMPVWIKEKLMLKRLILDELSELGDFDGNRVKLLFPEHHLSHAASAFYPSPFPEAAVVTIDGVGEWATASICHGQENRLTILRELHFPHSVGLLYSAFTYFLGFRVNSGEYKLMGLAPYGDPTSARVERYATLIRTHLVDLRPDGSIWLDQRYFDYATGLRMVHEARWRQLFDLPARKPEDELLPAHCDLALAIQQVTEEIVLNMVREAKRLTGSRYLCLAGGVALNCVANGRILKSGLFDDIWIQPAAGDAGGALGAAYCAHHILLDNPRIADGKTDRMKGSYLGPEYSDERIRKVARRYRAPFRHYESFGLLCDEVAGLLDAAKVVGWYQGRMEWGPRALGNRSILADARDPDMQKKLNLKVKFREGFRPFAPSVLIEEAGAYFDVETPSPYMLLIAEVREERRKALPEGYGSQGWREKLYHIRSDIPAVTHIDFSARLQTVHHETNARYWELLRAFRDRTQYGLLSNTSFNVRGEPIVCTPEDAYRCFMRTEIDYLVMGNFLFDKTRQPAWHEARDWRDSLGVD